MTAPRARATIVLIIVAGLLLAAAAVAALLHLSGVGVALAAAGIMLLLFTLFRKFGRRGDFNRSGWTGM